MSAMQKIRNIDCSTIPPTLMPPFKILSEGHIGLIPSTVKESTIRCTEYPKKKGKASVGKNHAKTKVIIKQVVKLCTNPLCFVNNCNGLKTAFLPKVENPESMSGIRLVTSTTKTKIGLFTTCGRKNKAANKPIAR